jgi:hypothetical protein
MKAWKAYRYAVAWCLVVLIAVPAPIVAQEGGAKPDARAHARAFSQAELDQLLAPVALYPDSLLAHIFIAATYPLEVVLAERWARENKSLPADRFNAALEKQPWDPSVKALVPFPDVLEMMSRKLDWTEKVGDAFLAQQADVMDTVQRLRKRAHDAGNLKSSEQQKVIVEREIIRVEPASPSVVYVPVYDPWWVYGPWWWPAYPPYAVYPYPAGVVIAPGFIWFGAGLFVGAYWGSWGYWGWHNHTCYVNRAYYYGGHGGHGGGAVGGAWATRQQGAPGTSGAAGGVAAAQPWQHNPAHRRGVAYRDTATGERFGQTNRAAVESRRSFRGYEGNVRGAGRAAGEGSPAMSARGTARHDPSVVRKALSSRAGRTDASMTRSGRPDASVRNDAPSSRAGRADAMSPRAGTPDRDVRRETGRPQAGAERRTDRAAVERGLAGRAFEGIGRGGEVRRQSTWGRESLNAARADGARAGEITRGFPQGVPRTGDTVRNFPQVRTGAGGDVRSMPQGGAGLGGAVRSMPQGGGRVGDAVRSFPQGGGAGGGFFRGGHR